MEFLPIFAMSSFLHKRTDVRLFPQIGIFYAYVYLICGTVTPCRSRNARQLVESLTTGSAVPFFLLSRTTTSNCFVKCQKSTTIAGRYIVVTLPARLVRVTRWPSPTPSSRWRSPSPTTGGSLPPGSARDAAVRRQQPIPFPFSRSVSTASSPAGKPLGAAGRKKPSTVSVVSSNRSALRTYGWHRRMHGYRSCCTGIMTNSRIDGIWL